MILKGHGRLQARQPLGPVVVKIDVAFSMLRLPDFPVAFPSQGSATPFRPVTSRVSCRSIAVGIDLALLDKRHDAWQGSRCPGRYDARAA